MKTLFGMTLLWLLAMEPAAAQWVAYNDHNRGTGTVARVTAYSLGMLNNKGVPAGGPLTNFLTGGRVSVPPAGISITSTGYINGVAGGSPPPNVGTPADQVFSGKIDWDSSGLYFAPAPYDAAVFYTFTNLNPSKRYYFKGTALRGGGYTTRWSLATLSGAASAKADHMVGIGSLGIITNGWSPYGNTMQPAIQAAWNSGDNLSGDVIAWSDIVLASNSFTVICSNWTRPTPGGAGNATYTYGFSAVMLEEVVVPPSIATQPAHANACVNGTATFVVAAAGSQPLAFQWHEIAGSVTKALPGGTNNVLSISNSVADAAFFVTITNQGGAVTSHVATLTVRNTAASFLSPNPPNRSVTVNSDTTFPIQINPASSQPLAVRWYYSGASTLPLPLDQPVTNNPSASTATLALTNVQVSQAGYYFAVISNCVNMRTSGVASLAIYFNPIAITNQPQGVTGYLGQAASMSVAVTGSAPQYQWFKGSAPIAGATNRILAFTNLAYSDVDAYHVVVSNPAGSVASSNAPLRVTQAPYAWVPLTNHAWRYSDEGVDLGTAWRAPDYDDGTWPQGPGVFGVEGAPIGPLINTPWNLGPEQEHYWTYYLRTRAVLTNNPATLRVVTTNLYDDGMVLYVNGREVYRLNMNPTDDILYNTPASGAAQENVYVVDSIPSDLLVEGVNTLAIEVHQANPTSADIVLGFAAVVEFPPPEPLSIASQPRSLEVTENSPATFTVEASGFPALYQWHKRADQSVTAIPGATRNTYTIPQTLLGRDDASYFVVVSNAVSQVTSADAQLVIVPDTIPPVLLDADGATGDSTVVLAFNEPLEIDPARPLASPTNAANFSVTNVFDGQSLTVVGAVFTNGTNVILTTAEPRLPGRNYVVTVGPYGVVDRAPRHNLAVNCAAPVSTVLTLVAMVSDFWLSEPYPAADPLDDYLSGAWKEPAYDPTASGLWYYPAWSLFYLRQGNRTSWPGNTALTAEIVASYYRKGFDFAGSLAGARLFLDPLADSGAAFYLNGVEVARTNLSAQPLGPTNFADGPISLDAPQGPWELSVTPLRPGVNWLAAELHAADNDLDLVFGVELEARIDSLGIGPALVVAPPADTAALESRPVQLSFKGVGGIAFQWRSNGVDLAGATNPVLTIPSTPYSANGARYSVRLIGQTNAVESAAGVLTVIPDTNAPVLLGAYLTASNIVVAIFSEPLSAATATNTAHYALTNAVGADAVIQRAALDGTNVILTLAGFTPGPITLVATEIRDLSAAGNWIATNSRVTLGLRDYPLATFATNTLWKYNEANQELLPTWYGTNYDDSGPGWQTGASVFDGKLTVDALTPRPSIDGLPVGTILSNIVLRNASYLYTYYFRKELTVPTLGPGATLRMSYIVDDGVAFYLNGKLFTFIRVAPPTSHGASASGNAVGDPYIEGPFLFDALTNLVAGRNVLAADVHQSGAASTDVSFGAELLLSVPSQVLPPGGPTNTPPPASPTLVISWQPPDVVLSWTSAAPFQLESAAAFNVPGTQWQAVTNQANPYRVPATNGPAFFRLRQ